MKLSVCPKCYEEGKIIKGTFLNSVVKDGIYFYAEHHCPKCQEPYKE